MTEESGLRWADIAPVAPPGYFGTVNGKPLSPPTLEARDRAIAPEVRDRLRAWGTQVVIDAAPHAPRLAGIYLRCHRCGQGVIRVSYGVPREGDAAVALVTPEAIEAAVFRHVLQVHRRAVDPEWKGSSS